MVDDSEKYELMDRADDAACLAELHGKLSLTKQMFYSFYVSGKKTTGISKAGIDECCRVLAQQKGEFIRVVEITFEPDPYQPERYCVFKCYAIRVQKINGVEVEMDRVVGLKRQALFQLVKRDDVKIEIPDPFWCEKGASKASRNARQSLLPMAVKEQFLAACIKHEEQKTTAARFPAIPSDVWDVIPSESLPSAFSGQKVSAARLAQDRTLTFTARTGGEMWGRQLLHIWAKDAQHSPELSALASKALAAFPSEKSTEDTKTDQQIKES